MAKRHRRQLVYAVGLFAVGMGLLFAGFEPAQRPELAALLLGVASFLLVWHMGLPLPFIGLISLERAPQFALLLAFGPYAAALINATAALIWPFTSTEYSHGSLRVALVRAAHNAGMVTLLMLIGGWSYGALEGTLPLTYPTGRDWVAVAGAAIAMQVANNLLMSVYFWLDNRDVRRLLTPGYVLGDLLFVPAGVLVGMLLARGAGVDFWLVVVLLVVVLLSFNQLSREQSGVSEDEYLSGSRRLLEVGEDVYGQCRTLFRFDEFYLVFIDRTAKSQDFLIHVKDGERLPRRSKPLERGLFGHVVETRRPVLFGNWEEVPPELSERAELVGQPSNSVIVVPLLRENRVVGVISVQSRQAQAYSAADLNLIERLSARFSGALADARAFEQLDQYRERLEEMVSDRTRELEEALRENQRLVDKLAERSEHLEKENREDALTGLANRRYLDEQLDQEIERAADLGYPLTVAMTDLDRFKEINDCHGHQVGDAVLREAAELLRQHCRAADLIARYGGEEFVIVLPGCDQVTGQEIAEEIRCGFESFDWGSVAQQLVVTTSIGVAQWRPEESREQVLSNADAMLYRAKQEGRNRVVVAGE